MIVRFLILSLVILGYTSCYHLGCYPLKDACYDCCKKAVVPFKSKLGSKKAWDMIEPCTEECVKFADSRDKDGYWVEEQGACLFDPDSYEMD
jgi:hypothetical protein